MKKLAGFLSLLVLILIQANAQKTSPIVLNYKQSQFNAIDINNYQLSDFKYHELKTDFNLSDQIYKSEDSYVYEPKTTFEQGQFNYAGNLSYFTQKESRKYQGLQRIFGALSSNSEIDEYSGYSSNKNENREYNLQISYLTNNSFYFNSKFFIAVNDYLSLYSNGFAHKQTQSSVVTETDRSQLNIHNDLPLQIGVGRIENVTDARLAIYILDDLYQNGRLDKLPVEADIFEFADFITKRLNKRVLDSRIKQIEDMMAIDTFLIKQGLAKSTDGLYFGLISDKIRYARLNSWNTGNRVCFQATPKISYGNYSSNKDMNDTVVYDYSDEYLRNAIELSFLFDAKKVLNLKWQHGYSFKSGIEMTKDKQSGNYSETSHEQMVFVEGGYQVSYIPNTRTMISAEMLLMGEKVFCNERADFIDIEPHFQIFGHYFFSPKLIVHASTSLHYRYNDNIEYAFMNKYENWNYSFNIGLTYSIF